MKRKNRKKNLKRNPKMILMLVNNHASIAFYFILLFGMAC